MNQTLELRLSLSLNLRTLTMYVYSCIIMRIGEILDRDWEVSESSSYLPIERETRSLTGSPSLEPMGGGGNSVLGQTSSRCWSRASSSSRHCGSGF